MSITIFNQYPYYDDFDETKNYMRILFRPGYSVQARELNQLQTAIQAQIDRFGSSIYKENARVLGGEVTVNNKVPYLKVENTYGNFSVNGDVANGIRSYLAKNADGSYQIIGKILRGTARGVSVNDIGNVRAEVIDIIPPVYESVDGTSVIKHPLTLQLRYLNSGGTPNAADDSLVNYFSPDEVITAEDNSFTFKAQPLDSNGAYPTGYGTRVFAEEAVYFVKGCFVHVPQSSINVATYSQTPYRRVVYNIIENVITSLDDPTLGDNSIGTPNESAPGANRYQIVLNLGLDSFDVNKKLSKNVIEIAKIRAGKLVGKEVTQYSELGKVLARRTYEESGNYYLSPIPLTTSELLKNVNDLDSDYVGGLYTQSQIRDFYNTETPISYGRERLALNVGKGGNVAYVYGYRIEFLDTQIVSTLKARDTSSKNNASVDGRVGNYLVCSLDESSSSSSIDLKYEPLEIYNASDELIGTARVRNIEYHSSTQLKIFLSNVTQLFDTDGLPIDSMSNMSYLASTQTEDDFIFNIDENTFVDENYHSYIFKNPCSATKSVTDISYVIRDSLTSDSNNVTTSSDQITLSVKSATTDQFEYSGINSFLVVDTDNAQIIEFESVTLDGTSKNATITFATSDDIPSNFTVYYDLKKTEQTESSILRRTKSLTSFNELITNPNRNGGGLDYLANYDIKRIVGVFTVSAEDSLESVTPDDTSIDITDHYILDNGQRENYYDLGALRLKCGCDGPPEGSPIRVYYEYYEWSQTGEYFTVDSYYIPEEVLTETEGFKYETIPTFNSIKYGEINLRDVIDFRPKLSEIESQTAITLARLPRIIGDFTFYLPRIDKLYINKDGELGIARGISSETPSVPDVPDEVMVLYTMRMNAYTFHPDDYVKTVHNHRRYTMKDIAKLDKRITNLEIFTKLNALEEETKNEQILDENGDDRFKNGFLADPCGGHIIGYTKDFEYNVSVNLEEDTYYPFTTNNDIRFILDDELTVSDYKKVGSKLLLPYAEVKYTGSPYATKPVEEIIEIVEEDPPVYGLSPNKFQLSDGESIDFNVSATNVEDGTKVWWVIDKKDYFEGYYTTLYGQLTITNQTASFSLDVNLKEALTENDVVKITLRPDSNGRPRGYDEGSISRTFTSGSRYDLVTPVSFTILGESVPPEETVPTYDFRISNTRVRNTRKYSNRNDYNETEFWVVTTGVPEGTTLYWNIERAAGTSSSADAGLLEPEDFIDNNGFSGTFTITSNGISNFITKVLNPDLSHWTRGYKYAKYFKVVLRENPITSASALNGLPSSFEDERNPPLDATLRVTLSRAREKELITGGGGKTTDQIIGTVDLSPQGDNAYSYDTRPIILFEDKLQGAFDAIKNSPNDNDEFLSYIYEGDIAHWIGRDLFSEENPEGQSVPTFFYEYNIPESTVSSMKFVSNQIALRMRSRKVYFQASGLVPNTRYFPKFGGFDISNYTIKEEFKRYSERDTQDVTTLYTNQTRHPNLTNSNEKIISDSRGYVSGSFIIPNNSEKFFLTNTNYSFLLTEDPNSSRNNRSFASTDYVATGDRDVNRKVYYVYLDNSVDQGDRSFRDLINQTEIEGSELVDENEGISFDNLENLTSQNYQLEYYQENISISEINNEIEVSRTLTLTGTESVSRSTIESRIQTLEKQNDVLYNYSFNTMNVSGLYVTEASSQINVLDFISDPFYLERALPEGQYSIRYVRLVTDSETENSVNPISDNPVFDTDVQRDINQTLISNEGNKFVAPNDSTN